MGRVSSAYNSLALALDPEHHNNGEALRAMRAITHLRSSYWNWFGDEAILKSREKDILFMGRTEELDRDFELLRAFIGLPEGVILPTDPKKGHRGGAGRRKSVLDKQAATNVREWYAKDYEFIELCDEWRECNVGPIAKPSLAENAPKVGP